MMKYKTKQHPVRDASIAEIKLVGHNAVRITICYSTQSKDSKTYHREMFDLTLCDVQWLGFRLHQIAAELKQKLETFKARISGVLK
jgi:hypothetical protein